VACYQIDSLSTNADEISGYDPAVLRNVGAGESLRSPGASFLVELDRSKTTYGYVLSALKIRIAD
jgi:hypothetical protein